ncbi:MAG TPA: hypothetical protein DCE41_32300 [Cytophagales bacterium]|nr:hypothetical protein [Cytophagales bacterium]HAA20193.1 hypothetical protein [Cytophagales bacterium]HAP58938.1 hypothetical protein [Cytophagales bacterium]
MTRYPVKPLLLCLIAGVTFGCANDIPLRGGPEDETPPTLVSSDPPSQALNVETETITLTFDEKVKVEQLGGELIVTPRLEKTPSYTIKGETVTLKMESPLADSTTYVFNFRESIKDVTQGNPVEGLALSFSTGNFIDSMYVEGIVIDPYNNKVIEEATVGLYPLGDTVDLFTGQPYYFTETDAGGNFIIRNIRAGKYTIWAWEDENDNLKADARNESYAFITDTLDLNGDSIPPIQFIIQQLNTQEFKINNTQADRYYKINFNKPVTAYSVVPLYDGDSVPLNILNNEGKTLQFYNPGITDSTGIIVTVKDTLQQEIVDTLWVKFKESQRRPDSFEMTLDPGDKTQISSPSLVTFTFTKPVEAFNLDSLKWELDSLNIFQVKTEQPSWNINRTELSTQIHLPDSITVMKLDRVDSVTLDTTFVKEYMGGTIGMSIPRGTIVSIEQDTLKETTLSYSREDTTQLAIMGGIIDLPNAPTVFIELIKGGKIERTLSATTEYRFNRLKPGDYEMRVLVDENGDGEWRPGNILTNTPAEKVFYYQGVINLRANWERTDVNITMPENPITPKPTEQPSEE